MAESTVRGMLIAVSGVSVAMEKNWDLVAKHLSILA